MHIGMLCVSMPHLQLFFACLLAQLAWLGLLNARPLTVIGSINHFFKMCLQTHHHMKLICAVAVTAACLLCRLLYWVVRPSLARKEMNSNNICTSLDGAPTSMECYEASSKRCSGARIATHQVLPLITVLCW